MEVLYTNEDIQALLESNKYGALNDLERHDIENLLENLSADVNQQMNESTYSSNVAQFTPILGPMVRRVYPRLIANSLLGTQVMKTPTGFMYALVNQYTGDHLPTKDSAGNVVETTANSFKIVRSKDDLSDIAKYFEGDLYLVLKSEDLSAYTIDAEYSNEAAFGIIFKNYSGSYTTAVAERLGREMREVGLTIVRKSIEAKSRANKGRYTVEMLQDLQSQHQMNATSEIMNLMAYEVQAGIDREVVDFVNTTAQQLPDTTFTAVSDTSGLVQVEKFRHEAIRIHKESALIGIDTKRGQGNVLLVSPKVCTMLEQLGSYKLITSDMGKVNHDVVGGEVATYDNRFKVVVDQYALSDYITVIYRGADRRDTMGVFAPYVPIQFTPVTDPDSGQPAVISKTRYALATIPGVSSADSNDRASTYARSFGVNFENTVLA